MNDKKWQLVILIAITSALLFCFIIQNNITLKIILGSIALSAVLTISIDLEECRQIDGFCLKKLCRKAGRNILIAIPVVSITVLSAYYLAV